MKVYQTQEERLEDKYKERANEKQYVKDIKEIKDRSCTDVLILLLFIFCLLSMFSVSIYTYIAGNLTKLKAPLDADLNFCGFG